MTEQSPAEQLFFAALAKSPVERAAYLDAHCPDPELRARVEKLLSAQPKVGDFLADSPAATGAFDTDRPTAEFAGRDEHLGAVLAGKYRLTEAIGEGGMGSVFLAQQTEPVKRAVAVKVIKAGMDTNAVLARFEAERQALALMDHPNIARVLDAGTTAGGRPFFVMELVKGVPVTDYCDAHKLTPRQRLELFVPVCQAIQHAHQKGVIHRDIKPSNVLVALYDDRPVPKVIDFGLAKAAGQTLTDKTLMTGFGAVVGTPEYMSPEQASLNNLDVDTRSDVYSLGVLLYELLTGSTPVDRKALGKAALLEVLRVVREVEAPRPSDKLSTSAALPSVAASRGTEPAKLSKLMRGELDWLVLKALEKDRTRRYDTANGLARDIQRYLADEVVEAKPPTAGYRVRKFMKRHKGQAIAAGVVLAALLVGIAGTTAGLWRADLARRRAEAAEAATADQLRETEAARQREAAERRRAEGETALAAAVTDFLKRDVLQLADPSALAADGVLKADADVRLRDVVVRAATAIDGRFADRPLVEAELRETLGVTLFGLGRSDLAVGQCERVRALTAAHLGPDHPVTLKSLGNLAVCYAGQGHHAAAVKLGEECLATQRRVLGADHPDTLKSLGNLASSYAEGGRPADAVRLLEECLATQRRVLGADHPDTLLSLYNLAVSHTAAGRPTAAVRLAEECLVAKRRVYGADHPATLSSLTLLANGYADLGRRADALRLREEGLAAERRVLGADHPSTLTGMYNLALSYAAVGRLEEALTLGEAAFSRRDAILGPSHVDTLRSLNNQIACLRLLDRHAEAIPRIDDFLGRAKGVAVPEWVARVCGWRAGYFRKLGDADGCRVTAARWDALGYTDADSLYNAACFRAIAAGLYAKSNQPAEATADADRAMARLTKAVAAGWKDRAHTMKDTDLDPIRGRADFQKLLVSLPELAPSPRLVK